MRCSRRARGFTLVEVLVAVVVICVGLLGIAKMQALSISNSNTSRQRSLAAIVSASLASAMHSNRNYWADIPATTTTLSGGTITSSDATLQSTATTDLGNLAACVGTSGGGAQCTAAQLAAYDLANWVTDLQAILPNPSATISCSVVAGNTAPTSCTIFIQWSEKAVSMTQQEATQQGVNQATASVPQFELPNYQLYVEP